MKKIIIEVETENPEGTKIYLKEVLDTLLKNSFFLIKGFNIKIVEEKAD
ncbi:MAG: hypothetical protein N3E47_04465 [Candidatus Bathyarchaeota archaeon]|nr:hypothetical protein [Candidatus Bathyarchaeota archaeon]